MIIKRTVTILAACAALLTGISLTAGTAAADTPARECLATPWTTTEPIRLTYHDLWTYTYTITWCAEDGHIVWVAPEVTYEELDPACVWQGTRENRALPDRDSDTWTTFVMSEFACLAEDGAGTRGVTPWAEVTVHPDGRYVVLGKDIAE
jgi:hypothetical protein